MGGLHIGATHVKLKCELVECCQAIKNKSDLFTVHIKEFPCWVSWKGQSTEAIILHTKDPERVLLGSLWESDNY